MSIFDVFKSPTHTVSGIVERFGPNFGSGEIHGYSLLIEGCAAPMLILRNTQLNDDPVGLTQAGDEVTVEVNDRGVVNLSNFQNKTLNLRFGK